MVVIRRQELISIVRRDAMYQNIVYGLDIKRFLDFGIGRDEQVYQNERRDESVERPRRERHGIKSRQEPNEL
jgi:hypothetical protein